MSWSTCDHGMMQLSDPELYWCCYWTGHQIVLSRNRKWFPVEVRFINVHVAVGPDTLPVSKLITCQWKNQSTATTPSVLLILFNETGGFVTFPCRLTVSVSLGEGIRVLGTTGLFNPSMMEFKALEMSPFIPHCSFRLPTNAGIFNIFKIFQDPQNI